MTNHFRSNLGLLAIAAAMSMTPLYAASVVYSTAGSFSCTTGGGFNCSTGTLVGPSGFSLGYTAQPTATPFNVTAPPITFAPFGSVAVTGPAAGKTVNLTSLVPGATFDLTVTQTIPSAGTASVTSKTIIGKITTGNTGGANITFTAGSPGVTATTDPNDNLAALSFNLGYVTYYIDDFTPIHPSTGGSNVINGAIDAPEPTLYTAVFLGLGGLLALGIKRKKQTSV